MSTAGSPVFQLSVMTSPLGAVRPRLGDLLEAGTLQGLFLAPSCAHPSEWKGVLTVNI